jgi:hypothetical protein
MPKVLAQDVNAGRSTVGQGGLEVIDRIAVAQVLVSDATRGQKKSRNRSRRSAYRVQDCVEVRSTSAVAPLPSDYVGAWLR